LQADRLDLSRVVSWVWLRKATISSPGGRHDGSTCLATMSARSVVSRAIALVVLAIAPQRVAAERSMVLTVIDPESLARQSPEGSRCQLTSHPRRPSKRLRRRASASSAGSIAAMNTLLRNGRRHPQGPVGPVGGPGSRFVITMRSLDSSPLPISFAHVSRREVTPIPAPHSCRPSCPTVTIVRAFLVVHQNAGYDELSVGPDAFRAVKRAKK
jgi:hypothetical protein